MNPMPIIKTDEWNHCVEINSDPYGKPTVDTARRLMEILDEDESPITDVHALVCRADEESGAGGITGFMAGCVASMVSHLHSRGEEFRRAWNDSYHMSPEKDKGGVVNPALLTIG